MYNSISVKQFKSYIGAFGKESWRMSSSQKIYIQITDDDDIQNMLSTIATCNSIRYSDFLLILDSKPKTITRWGLDGTSRL